MASLSWKIKLALLVTALLALSQPAHAADWMMPRAQGDPPCWGLNGGIKFGIFPGSLWPNEQGGPRGLIRIWYPSVSGKNYSLITFIAVEPTAANGAKGFSELELSKSDQKKGKVIRVEEPATISTLPSGAECLTVKLGVERFDNGAHMSLLVSVYDDRPDEVHFKIFREADSAPIRSCVLTATWGNFTRARLLWLKDQIVNSRKVYLLHSGNGFARDLFFRVNQLCRMPNGAAIAAITSDEKDPAAVYPVPGSQRLHYTGVPVTQYWKKPPNQIHRNLLVRVNGRSQYWASAVQVPGGVAFENFEMRDAFYNGEDYTFGVTTNTPEELGMVGQKKVRH